MYVYMIALILSCSGMSVRAMSTLSQARFFAAHHAEDIPAENRDEFNPSYVQFYENMEPGLVRRFLQAIGVVKTFAHGIDVNEFRKDLKAVVNQRELAGYTEKHVRILPVKKGEKIILFGALQGQVHSLIRGLSELESQGLLSDDFSLADNCYLIFNGDVIGRSPYNLEIIELMVALLYKNPERVIYIRGVYEEENYGENVLINFLRALNEHHQHERYTLINLIKRLFATLPVAVYLNYSQGKELLRISGVGRENNRINERMMGDFFESPQEHGGMYRIRYAVPVKQPVHVRAVIKNMDTYYDYVPHDGVKLLEPFGGATVWGIFSSPSRLAALVSKFYMDVFSIITVGDSLKEVTLTVYNRDKRSQEPFMQHKQYLVYGTEEIAPGKTAAETIRDEIVLGSSLDLTKRVGALGKAVRQGVSVALQECNTTDGVQGKKLKVIMLDDGYDPAQFSANFDYLMREEKVSTFVLPVGSPTLESTADILKTDAVAVLFPVSGAQEFRSPALRSVINWRASYRDELHALLPYLMEKHHPKRFVIFYQDDIYGTGPLEVTKKLLQNYAVEEIVEIPYSRHTTEFKDVAEKIIAAKPDAIALFSASEPTKEMIRQLGIGPLVGVQVFGLSFLADETFKRFSKDFGYRYLFSSVVPDPKTSDVPIV